MPKEIPNSNNSLENYVQLRRTSLNKFAQLFRQITECAGLTQGKLSHLAKEKISTLTETPIKGKEFGSLEQPTISKIMNAQQEPTHSQLFILFVVIKEHYKSKELIDLCRNKNVLVPEFSPELENIMWALALYSSPDTVLNAEIAAKNFSFGESLIEHKEERWQRR